MNYSPEQWEQIERETLQARLSAGLGGLGTGHPDTDRRVLELTRITVPRIDEDPSLVRVGTENIERWTRQKRGYLPRCHAEWKQLIEQHPWKVLREMLLEESDEGQWLTTDRKVSRVAREAAARSEDRVHGTAARIDVDRDVAIVSNPHRSR